MKIRITYILILFFTVMAFSQDNTERKIPEIISKVMIGETATLPDGETTITLTHIASDSRCPIGTTCVWAGEIEFDIAVKHDGNWIKKTYKIPGGPVTQLQEMIKFDEHIAFASNITPVPEAGKKLEAKDYTLHFIVKKVASDTQE